MNTSDLINEMIDTMDRVAPPSEQEPEENQGFKLNTKLDHEGFPIEHKGYIKPNCKQCYGRGFVTYLYGKAPNQKRKPESCPCINKGYNKMRREFPAQVAQLAKEQEILESTAKKYIMDFLFGDMK